VLAARSIDFLVEARRHAEVGPRSDGGSDVVDAEQRPGADEQPVDALGVSDRLGGRCWSIRGA